MNENSQPLALAIKSWIAQASRQLKEAGISSHLLDAEIILAHTLRKNRTFLHAHQDEVLEFNDLEVANARLRLRLDHVPVAYIIGHKEFYDRNFKVTPSTLIPRPETEMIIDTIKDLTSRASLLADKMILVDVGTGSGCIGITIKLERPELDVTLIDISQSALKIASTNSKLLNADVKTLKSNLLSDYPFKADIIVANLPYVDESWEFLSPELRHEPSIALYAEEQGLALIFKLIDQSVDKLIDSGYIVLEADPSQHKKIIEYAKQYKLLNYKSEDFCLVLQKI
jgi:release factor glutamine methyltransferase